MLETASRVIAADVLDFAAARLERTELHKDGYYPGWVDELGSPEYPEEVAAHLLLHPEVACCTLGAIAYASAVKGAPVDVAEWALAEHLGLAAPANIPDWSDERGRTAQDVITAMRECAEVRRAEQLVSA